jgi:DNA-binding NarL/FixJ family response regulator
MRIAVDVLNIIQADPQTLVRAGLRQLLETIDGVHVVAESGDGRQLLDQVIALRPHIVVTELNLPEISGLEVLKRIVRHLPDVRVLVLSSSVESSHVRSALKAGAAGFLAKSAEPAELELAVRAVARGQCYLSPSVSHHAIERRRADREAQSVILSQRQREVLRLIGRGKSTKEIASLLGIGNKTVETHRARLMQALSLSNTHSLMHFAVKTVLEAVDER